MGVFEKAFPKNIFGLAIGVGLALTAPVFLVAAESLLRPLAKTALKAGFIVWDAAVGLYGAAGDRLTAGVPQEAAATPVSMTELPKPEMKAEPVPEPPKAEIEQIKGIGEAYAKRLESADIKVIDELLKEGATPKGREQIAKKTGISDTLILRWINMADLFRIKGIGEEYADFLEAAGVDTVPELAQRNAEHLYNKLVAVNEEHNMVGRMPSQNEVTDWIDQAKLLDRVVMY
jgi:predicted flap endonuclease-1-like 5' DNA nuclease